MEQIYLMDGKAKRKAKEVVCIECGKIWLIRLDRENSGYCSSCLTKGIRNPMFGSIAWNKGINTYKRVSYKKEMKKKIVAMFGNKCKLCQAYNLPIVSYEFHHINLSEKDNEISKILLWKWEKLENELRKCVMLCSNCHKEVHFGSERLEVVL